MANKEQKGKESKGKKPKMKDGIGKKDGGFTKEDTIGGAYKKGGKVKAGIPR